jgi:cyanate lyase
MDANPVLSARKILRSLQERGGGIALALTLLGKTLNFDKEDDEMADRSALSSIILEKKLANKLTWQAIAAEIAPGASPIFITAALLGQMTLTTDQAAAAAKVFDLSPEQQALLTVPPYRGSLPPGPPTDPLIYRFYELIQVYGTTFKELIQEEFGDGIMSAIDFDMQMERQPDPKGDRVKITMSGKFLPYRRY